jgi:hypothetical protein
VIKGTFVPERIESFGLSTALRQIGTMGVRSGPAVAPPPRESGPGSVRTSITPCPRRPAPPPAASFSSIPQELRTHSSVPCSMSDPPPETDPHGKTGQRFPEGCDPNFHIEIRFTVSPVGQRGIVGQFCTLPYIQQFAVLNFQLTAFANCGTRLARIRTAVGRV